jgi:RNA-directed DNA polymerase
MNLPQVIIDTINFMKKLIKEAFKPEYTVLDLSLKDAYRIVLEKQTKISVAFQNNIPKDILLFYSCLSKDLENESNTISDDINKIDMTSILRINKMVKILVESKAARIVAVHRVITNKGYRSKGLSENHPTNNDEYVQIVEWLKRTMRKPENYVASPLDRIYIPKKANMNVISNISKPSQVNGDTYSKESLLRPISIPSIKDRCLQAAYNIGLSIFSEYMADDHSYAFRPGRSPAWAAHSIAAHLRFSFKPTWIVEIDIAKCYDRINHEFIIQNTPFIPKQILRNWLKSGYIIRNFEQLGLFTIDDGIPQGGIISPSISNIVLDGADSYIRNILSEEIKQKKITAKMAGYYQLRPESKIFILFRFADDVIIMAKSRYIAERTRQLFAEFIKPRGLELSDKKTRITNVSGNEASFTFVGYEFLKSFSLASNKPRWYIQPPKENVQRVRNNLSLICRKKTTVNTLFHDFNLALSSWCGYYASANSKSVFKQLNRWVFNVFYFALVRRIKTNKSIRIERMKRKSGNKYKKKKIDKKYIYRVINRYFMSYINYHGKLGRMKWFYIKRNNNRKKYLYLFSPVIFRLIDQSNNKLTKMGLNYYNINDYASITEINLSYKYGVKRRILNKNFSKYRILTCTCCERPFREVGKYEIHHICPKEFGGSNSESNLTLVCISCHQDITTAIARRNIKECEYYINRELVKIPEHHLSKFTK